MSLRIKSAVGSERVDTFQGLCVGCLGVHSPPLNIQRNLHLLISAAGGSGNIAVCSTLSVEHKALLQLTKKATFTLGSYALNPADVYIWGSLWREGILAIGKLTVTITFWMCLSAYAPHKERNESSRSQIFLDSVSPITTLIFECFH